MKLLYKYHFLFFGAATSFCYFLFRGCYGVNLGIDYMPIEILTFLDEPFYEGGQRLENTGGSTSFWWWIRSAYLSFWWLAAGFSIVWIFNLKLIEWLTIAHITISLALLFGFSIYVLVAEQPWVYSTRDLSFDIINLFFLFGWGLLLLNILLSLIRKLF